MFASFIVISLFSCLETSFSVLLEGILGGLIIEEFWTSVEIVLIG